MIEKYEISVWDDILVQASGSIPAHFEEEKICVIGSNTMTSPDRALEPKMVQNINGTNTFTFKMYYVIDEFGVRHKNPFQKYLVNERKIKVFWKNEWYDLVVKDCQEDSSAKSVTYTCKDLYINELSKTGWDLEFDTELENNQGTVNELAHKILENTDWQVDDSNSNVVLQSIEEPVYEVSTQAQITGVAVNMETGAETSITIPTNSPVLVYYSNIANQDPFLQFWYAPGGSYQTDGSSMLVLNGQCVGYEGGAWLKNDTDGYYYYWSYALNRTIVTITYSQMVSLLYRAKRLVRSQLQVLDQLTGKYCDVYTNNGTPEAQYYAYSETEYSDAITITNLITNDKYFSDTIGWFGAGISFKLEDGSFDLNTHSFISLQNNAVIYNTGLRDFRSYIPKGFSNGEQYIFRIKAMTQNSSLEPSGTYAGPSDVKAVPFIGTYTYDETTNTYTKTGSSYFSVGSPTSNGDWVEFLLTCQTSASFSQLENLGFFIDNTPTGNIKLWLENVQFFKYAEGEPVIQEYNELASYVEDDTVIDDGVYYKCIRNNSPAVDPSGAGGSNYWTNIGSTAPTSARLNPGSFSAQSYANEVWKLFVAGQNVSIPENVVYAYSGTKDGLKTFLSNNGLYPKYGPNTKYEKIRSIEGKQSNRFNLLQSLAETFEVWVRFTIQHDSNGKMTYINGVPQKFVSFVNEVGERKGLVFKYGIDLKTISRTVNSDQITSKVIVPANNNQFGENGFCTIARADENYPRVGFILNFDYYISQGLLSRDQFLNDLYSTDAQYLGYYVHLREWNLALEAIADELAKKKAELDKLLAQKVVLEGLIEQTNQQIEEVEADLASMAGYGCYCGTEIDVYLGPGRGNSDPLAQSARAVRAKLLNDLEFYEAQLRNISTSVTAIQNRIAVLELNQSSYVSLVEALDVEFFKKYSRFIQEGSWTSDDYYDDNLYYYDALSTAYTSSRPQISYNISVFRVSSLEEFKNKIFELGDIAYIQDIDFFGYATDGITPYKMEVVITEITSNFDAPQNDEIKVQNYKTQFEDLFQRIAATTQTLQFTTGAYNNTVNNFTVTGEIKSTVLQESIDADSSFSLKGRNGSVNVSKEGITISDPKVPANMMRITATGIDLSQDKGHTWKQAITANGIKPQQLTTGFIETDKISISDGGNPTFKWDKYGITAYEFDTDPDHGDKPINIQDGHFVRFDKYGIYGIRKDTLPADWKASGLADIKANANFGVIWDGFFIKSNDHNGYVQITSDNDFQVMDTSSGSEVERIKIGNIGTSANPEYGIRISDAVGGSVLECGGNGELWLKKALHVETLTEGHDVSIGTLGDGNVINVNDVFVVNEDGEVTATNINITGGSISVPIVGGSIGNIQLHSDTSTIGGTGTLDGMTIDGGSWT